MDDSCDSHEFDGGECLHCGIKSLCELCDEEFWEGRCAQCEGGRICDSCSYRCNKCWNRICVICAEENDDAKDANLCNYCYTKEQKSKKVKKSIPKIN